MGHSGIGPVDYNFLVGHEYQITYWDEGRYKNFTGFFRNQMNQFSVFEIAGQQGSSENLYGGIKIIKKNSIISIEETGNIRGGRKYLNRNKKKRKTKSSVKKYKKSNKKTKNNKK
jgi:hypothetical protein